MIITLSTTLRITQASIRSPQRTYSLLVYLAGFYLCVDGDGLMGIPRYNLRNRATRPFGYLIMIHNPRDPSLLIHGVRLLHP